jgi:NADH-quinone oxidoreductase subunit C
MGGPVERPVPDDAAPDQSAASAAPTTVGTGTVDAASARTVKDVPSTGMFGVAGSGDTSGFGGLVRDIWSTPTAERPYGSYFDDIVDALLEAYPEAEDAILQVSTDRGELTLHLKREHLLGVATALRDNENLRFELCSSVSGVDYPNSVERLHSVTHLTSMTYRRRMRLEVAVTAEDPTVPSLTSIYPGTDWQEREAFDMFGIVYAGHPGLTRILMPDDWDGHPQRKDYPLGGIPVQYKGATIPPPDERRVYK